MEKMDFVGLHNLVAPRNARKAKKRIGRGESSGHGKTSGRGNKGQKARKSGNVRPGFEGGQIPLISRQPKRGFSRARFLDATCVVNLGRIADRFEANSVVDPIALLGAGLITKITDRVKVLGNGDVNSALQLRVHAISKSAAEKVAAKGGKVELIGKM